MSEEQLKELQEYNLEYLEAQASEEMFGGDYTSAVELKQANKEIERLHNIINELEKWLVEWREMLDCPDFYEEGIIDCINDTLTELQELKGSDKK